MKRSLLVVVSLGFLALAACSSSSAGSPLEKDEDESEPTEGSTKKSGTTNESPSAPPASTAPPAAPPPATPPAPPSTGAQCAASADAFACVECCAKDLPEVDQTTCTCDATSPCKAACDGNLCGGKAPNLACGQCLLANFEKIQTCLEQVVEAPKACIEQAGCLSKPGAENLDLPF